ncbi:MAG: hypothetical protein WA960_02210 [Tunicatimonas sp.]
MFTDPELRCLQDTRFLRTKATATQKVQQLLNQTLDELQQYLANHPRAFPAHVQTRAGKLARGENYRGFPYLVLDYPRQFSQDDVFALRTMFWWGHFYSITFQLGGASWVRYRPAVQRNLPQLSGKSVWLGVNDDPWQHHRQPDNYRPLDTLSAEEQQNQLEDANFLKLARFLPVDAWELLPQAASLFLGEVINLIELE